MDTRQTLPIMKGALVALWAIAIIELITRFIGRPESPPAMLTIAVILAAYWGAIRGGLACAMVLIAYGMIAWSLPGSGWNNPEEIMGRMGVLALPIAALLVGFLKNRSVQRFEELKASESRIRALHDELTAALRSRDQILNQSLDVICSINAAGQFTMVSAACERIWGYTPDELIGRRYMELVHPEDHARTTVEAARIMAGVSTVDFINRYIRKDGSVLHVMWSACWCVEDQLMYAVARDYTEQKSVDEERARHVAIIEATSDLVGMYWSDGRLSYINKAGRQMLGIGEDEDVSKIRVNELYTDWAATLLSGVAAMTALDRGVWTGETTLKPRSGDPIQVSQILLAHRRPGGSVEFMSTIARDITKIKEMEARLREEAATDALTGLLNRRHFMERLRSLLHSAQRRHQPLSFALCDLDGFKQINDRHGHLVGDQVLKAVAAILHDEIRGEDIVGRYGGDEFYVAFPQVPSRQSLACLERIRGRVGKLVFLEGDKQFSITMTCGLVDLKPEHTTEDALIDAADQALYQAKAEGKDRVSLGC
jgi:diguanylate cyclase (GGDEF)-like protein/PAS domain S-box-containing protein